MSGVAKRVDRFVHQKFFKFSMINKLQHPGKIHTLKQGFLPFLLWLGVSFSLSACGKTEIPVPSHPWPSSAKPAKGTQKPYSIGGKRYYPLPTAIGYDEVGYASWYGPGFHGKRTANGERYNMHAMTAAHKILPMNTLVRVKNLSNGREVVVRINDRGPFVKGRIIDLSREAARRIGMMGSGTTKVRVTALAEISRSSGNRIVYVKRPDLKHGNFYVQVGAFTSRSNAVRLQARLQGKYGDVRVLPVVIDARRFFRVQVKAPSLLSDARAFEWKLEADGFPMAFLVAY